MRKTTKKKPAPLPKLPPRKTTTRRTTRTTVNRRRISPKQVRTVRVTRSVIVTTTT